VEDEMQARNGTRDVKGIHPRSVTSERDADWSIMYSRRNVSHVWDVLLSIAREGRIMVCIGGSVNVMMTVILAATISASWYAP
jgi:hypothetical protein